MCPTDAEREHQRMPEAELLEDIEQILGEIRKSLPCTAHPKPGDFRPFGLAARAFLER